MLIQSINKFINLNRTPNVLIDEKNNQMRVEFFNLENEVTGCVQVFESRKKEPQEIGISITVKPKQKGKKVGMQIETVLSHKEKFVTVDTSFIEIKLYGQEGKELELEVSLGELIVKGSTEKELCINIVSKIIDYFKENVRGFANNLEDKIYSMNTSFFEKLFDTVVKGEVRNY